MKELSVVRMGLSLGAALAVVYTGCVVLMTTLSPDQTVAFFNTLIHGIDVAPIMRWEMAWWEAIIGVVQTFILGWFFGALIASLYNLLDRIEAGRRDRS